jgi:hypothetical protein
MDSSYSRHITENNKWFSSLTPLLHKEYVNFGNDKKGKVLSTSIIKINDYFTLNNVALVDNLRYNLLFVSQLVNADLDILFHKFLILLTSLFVTFLTLEKSFKLIFYLLNLL